MNATETIWPPVESSHYTYASNMATLSILIMTILTLLTVYLLYFSLEAYERSHNKANAKESIVHPTWGKATKICEGSRILVRSLFGCAKGVVPMISEHLPGAKATSKRESSGRSLSSFSSFIGMRRKTSERNKAGAAATMMKIHRQVRLWVTEREETKVTMNRISLKFKDINIEEQFSYYYLYLHKEYNRNTVILGVLLTIGNIPFAPFNIFPRILGLFLMALVMFFNSTDRMDDTFWIADWGLGFTWLFLGFAGSAALSFDDILDPESYDNESPLHRPVGMWMIFAAVWSLITGTVWRKKVILVTLSSFIQGFFIMTNAMTREHWLPEGRLEFTSGQMNESIGRKSRYNEFLALGLIFFYTLVLLGISRIVEGHIRMQFLKSWELVQKKFEQDELLQKQRFSVEQLQIIRDIMENRNEDIDMELQEVLINSEELQLEEMLGKGAYGEVFKANYEGIHVAVKVIKDISEDALERTRAEILLMKGLHHPQIVMFIGACWDEFMMGIVLELVENGPMANFLHNKKLHLNWQHPKLSMAKDAAEGCRYLHNSTYYDEREDTWHECIIHRDLKPDNMLVTATYGVKLTDFGEARAMDSEMTMTQVGSPLYMAPEVLRGERYDERVDIYSYGVTMLEMLVLADNIYAVFEKEYKRIKGENMTLTPLVLTRMVAMENFRPTLPDFVPKSLAALIRDCWSADANQRPNFEKILERLDGEIHDEIYTEIDGAQTFSETPNAADGATSYRKARVTRGIRGSIENHAQRGFRGSMENQHQRDARGTRGFRGSLEVNKRASPHSPEFRSLQRASSGSNISEGPRGHSQSIAPARRGMHMKRMMSVKRGGHHDTFAGHTVNLNNAALAAKQARLSATNAAAGGGPPGLEGVGGSSATPKPRKSIELLQNKNELAKQKAENESLKKELEKAKKEAEANLKRAETSAKQLQLAQKNARQARMDMNERRKENNANARKASMELRKASVAIEAMAPAGHRKSTGSEEHGNTLMGIKKLNTLGRAGWKEAGANIMSALRKGSVQTDDGKEGEGGEANISRIISD
mmetsp:Transcript_1746/g.3414  ORF Transcript_1746/g.3414 Transcript_1746/m.3414 type:complete len:1047 (-) Transcript_1746:22-3162(-)